MRPRTADTPESVLRKSGFLKGVIMSLKPTWKNTFNSQLRKEPWNMSEAQKMARESGYLFFTWAGIVLPVNHPYRSASPCLVDDLDEIPY